MYPSSILDLVRIKIVTMIESSYNGMGAIMRGIESIKFGSRVKDTGRKGRRSEGLIPKSNHGNDTPYVFTWLGGLEIAKA